MRTVNIHARRLAHVAIGLTLLSLAAGSARATVIGCGGTNQCTLQELAAGASMTVNDKLFSNFLFGSFADPVDTSLITVVGLDDGGSDPGPGLRFDSPALQVTGAGVFDFELFFDVSTVSGEALIKDNSLVMEGAITGAGAIIIQESVLDANFDFIGDKLVELADGVSLLSDSADFAPQSLVTVQATVAVQANGGGAVLSSWEMRFSQVVLPAPGPLALLAAGLIAIGWPRGRRSE